MAEPWSFNRMVQTSNAFMAKVLKLQDEERKEKDDAANEATVRSPTSNHTRPA